MPSNVYTATIVKSEQVAVSTKLYRLTFDGLESFDFLPGQFVMLWIDGVTDDKGVTLKRAYSICSSPHAKDYLELCVKAENPAGFAERLHALPVGSTVHLQGPFGHFMLREACDDDLIFIGGGTGIAPLISMIRTVIHEGRKNKMVLFYSVKDEDRYLYRDVIEQLMNEDVNFHPIIHMTSPAVETWKGELGRIDEKRIKKYLGDDLSRCKVFLCGSRDMVKGLKETVIALGAKLENVFHESWG